MRPNRAMNTLEPRSRHLVALLAMLSAAAFGGAFPTASPTDAAIAAAPKVASAIDAVTPPGQTEAIPDYFYGSSAVPPGTLIDRVYNRFILSSSVVFLAVDTTSWPQNDLSLPGLVLVGQADGFFDVKALTDANAPPPGIPYSYVVFNARATGPYIIGDDGAIPSGGYNGSVSNSAVKSTSEVFLTSRAIGESRRALPDVKVNNHGAGFFTVTTTNNAVPAGGEHFNYLIVNEVGFSGGQFYSGCRQICGTAVVPQGHTNVGVPFAGVSAPAAVFVTEDITRLPADNALPAIKVNNHGAGFFTATTANLSLAPTTALGGIPFNFLVFQPPHQWEEYGPTGRSGNTWTIAVDPRDPLHTWYVGSTHGGAWKTTNAGDTWYQAWKDQATGATLPMIGVYYLSFSPGGRLFALTDDGRVYRSSDHAATWSRLPDVPVSLPTTGGPYGGGAYVIADSNDIPYVCADKGLFELINGTWQLVGVTSVSGLRCSQVLIDGSTLYAAFRGAGLYQLQSFGSWRLLKPATSVAEAPIRVAVNGTKIVVNDDCNVWIRNKSDLSASNVATTWGASIVGTLDGKVCDATGSSATVAISPDGTHVAAGGRGVWLSTNAGSPTPTFPVHLFTAQVPETGETRQFMMVDNSTFVAAVDGGIRLSYDGGATWRESEHRFREVDGPPTTEFYDLGVSAPNQFGQVLMGGSVQDIGGVGLLGRPTGLGCCTAEWGVVGVAAKPVDTSTAGSPTSTATVIGTRDEDGSDNGRISKSLRSCRFTTSLAPLTRDAAGQEGYFPAGSCSETTAFVGADTITSIATAPFATNAVLVGGSQGTVVAGDPSSSTLQFKVVLAGSGDAVTALVIASQMYAYVGFESGRVVRITEPFGQYHADPVTVAGAPASRVNAMANRYGDMSELYVAYAKQLFVSTDGGTSWAPRLPSPSASPPEQPATIADALAVSDIVGVVRDPDHPVAILALGRTRNILQSGLAYEAWDYAPGSIWTTTAPVGFSATWTGLNEGLPPSTPITGIGLSPSKALFIATQGRGIWWRRDVISGLPNSGVNTPDHGLSRPGELVIFDTRCSYPGGWRHIRLLEFKLAMGHGPGDDAPAALWIALDTARGVIRLYDPRTGRWLEGPPGAHATLATEYVVVRLDQTNFGQLAGAEVPTVDIHWALSFTGHAVGELQQYLRVTDDQGNRTSWDKVGQWEVMAAR
jgi:hypothetical protein